MTDAANWWLIGAYCGFYLLLTKRVRDWSLLPVFIALGPMTVVFYLAALIQAAIRKR